MNTIKKKGLGRGLSALFGDSTPQTTTKNSETKRVSISDLTRNPYQPRETFNEFKLDELANSIKKNGIIQPIAVRYKKSEPGKYDSFIAASKGWMDNFDEITYNAEVWLQGTDSLGVSNGSVRTYGVWTAKNPMNGNAITTNAYHSFEFNAKGQIHEMRDYFDASGAMAAAMKETSIE